MYEFHPFTEVEQIVPVTINRVSLPIGAEGYNPRTHDFRVLAERALLLSQLYTTHKEARTDELTGAGNHRAFNEWVESYLNDEASDQNLALIYVDVDGMKRVNDSDGGHAQGDAILRLISDVVREEDPIFCFGGDEFAIPIVGFTPSPNDTNGEVTAKRIAARYENKLNAAIGDNQKWFDVYAGVSVGVAVYESGDDLEALKLRADEDMARNKEARKRHLEDRGIVFQDSRQVVDDPVVRARRKREGWGVADDFGNEID